MIEMIGRPGSDIYLHRAVFDKNKISEILEFYISSKNQSNKDGHISGEFETIQISENNIDISRLVISKLEKCLIDIFGNTFSPVSLPDKRTSIKIQATGQRHPLHSDSSKTTHSGYNYGENLAYSGILSMSDDYTGGEVNFPGDKAFARLGAGDAIFFPSQKHIHQVEMVDSGKRFTFLTFWENCE